MKFQCFQKNVHLTVGALYFIFELLSKTSARKKESENDSVLLLSSERYILQPSGY